MEFGKFIRSLLPTFSRDQVQEDLDAIRDELDKYVLPVYQLLLMKFSRRNLITVIKATILRRLKMHLKIQKS